MYANQTGTRSLGPLARLVPRIGKLPRRLPVRVPLRANTSKKVCMPSTSASNSLLVRVVQFVEVVPFVCRSPVAPEPRKHALVHLFQHQFVGLCGPIWTPVDFRKVTLAAMSGRTPC